MRLLACALFLVCALSACASLRSDPFPEVFAALQASEEAWNRGDLKGHLAIYDESVTAMTKNGPRPGIAPIEAAFTKAYFRDGKPRQQLRTEQLNVRPLSGDSALMTGRFILSGGGEPEQSGWFTLIWQRTPSGWKVVHDHTS